MTNEQKAAYVISQSIAAMIEVEGMKATNAGRQSRGEGLAYEEDEFCDVIDRYGLDHDKIMVLFDNP